MLTFLAILWSGFKMALQELWLNKLRTFLSLLGITIGIFCIIGVLSTLDSMKRKVQGEIQSLGSNSIWIDKFDYGAGGGGNFPWWKYIKRPNQKYREMLTLKDNSTLTKNISYFVPGNVTVEYKNNALENVNLYGISEDFSKIQNLTIGAGRYLNESEFKNEQPVCVMGYTNAEKIFGTAERAVGKSITINNKRTIIVGVITKQGKNLLDGFAFDDCMIISYRFYCTMFNPENSGQNLIIAQAKDDVKSTVLIDQLRGIMRQIRRLSPTAEDNFALNDLNKFSEKTEEFFGVVNMAGWFIAGLSLLVGAFGVANIMFVTVRERTSQIGLKKALGAKKSVILTEFLLESSLLCTFGGLLGLLLVWILALILSSMLPFAIYIAPNIIGLAFSVCIILGIISGIIPALMAARMDPVVAIRSK